MIHSAAHRIIDEDAGMYWFDALRTKETAFGNNLRSARVWRNLLLNCD